MQLGRHQSLTIFTALGKLLRPSLGLMLALALGLSACGPGSGGSGVPSVGVVNAPPPIAGSPTTFKVEVIETASGTLNPGVPTAIDRTVIIAGTRYAESLVDVFLRDGTVSNFEALKVGQEVLLEAVLQANGSARWKVTILQ